MQASQRLWQTRCVPQCARACEQVARSWADASLWDIATNGTLSTATRIVPRSSRAITSPHKRRCAQILYSKTGPCENRNRGAENRRRLLAEMSHQIVFGFAAVAESAHAALPSIITISQNRGDASAREPRTYHGRGFSLLAAPDSCCDPLSGLPQVRRFALVVRG